MAGTILGVALSEVGLLDSWVTRRIRRGGANWLIAMYHRVVEDGRSDPFDFGMSVSKSRFREQVQFLKSLGQVRHIADVARDIVAGQQIREPQVSISFDDGYVDNVAHAAPILREMGVPWTLYLPLEGLEDGASLWWDRAVDIIRGWPNGTLDLRRFGIGQLRQQINTSHDAKPEAARTFVNLLWLLPTYARREVLATLSSELELSPVGGTRRASISQIQELARAGVEIGAHSISHPDFRRIPDAELHREIATARVQFQAIVDRKPSGLAFPAGFFDDRAINIARQAGYDYAVAVRSDYNHSASDVFRLARVGIPDRPLRDVKRALAMIGWRSRYLAAG
jgi:peptidoglycan/xylan/chitin deacetylase (PgdA/CDA1 family)